MPELLNQNRCPFIFNRGQIDFLTGSNRSECASRGRCCSPQQTTGGLSAHGHRRSFAVHLKKARRSFVFEVNCFGAQRREYPLTSAPPLLLIFLPHPRPSSSSSTTISCDAPSNSARYYSYLRSLFAPGRQNKYTRAHAQRYLIKKTRRPKPQQHFITTETQPRQNA